MSQVNVYRYFGNHSKLEFRTYRTSLQDALDSTIDSFRLGAAYGLKLLENFGGQAPKKYVDLWDGKNPVLDSTYAFLSHPNEQELNIREITTHVIMPNGSLSEGKKELEKTIWAKLTVDAEKCLVAPHVLAGKIISLRKLENIPEYWSNTYVLEYFLKKYVPIGACQSERNWEEKSSGKKYDAPEVLIPLNAIDYSNCEFLNN